ncbi:MAG: hypothetical protein Q7S54_01495 [bacterium]|nr:hypothetical protein [bacterium]
MSGLTVLEGWLWLALALTLASGLILVLVAKIIQNSPTSAKAFKGAKNTAVLTAVLKESDALAADLLASGFTPDLGDRIITFLELLQRSGKLTYDIQDRQRLSAALGFWAAVLALESNSVLRVPMLAEPARDT